MSSDSNSSERLAEQATSGDSEALAVLFERYRPRLARMVRLRLDRRLQGRVSASDIVQETFMELPRRLAMDKPPPTIPFFLWIRMIAAQRILQVHRHHLGTAKRDASRDIMIFSAPYPDACSHSLADGLLAELTSPSRAAVRAELRVKLHEILCDMEPIDREILALRHFEEMSNSEAALVLGISKAAASKRYVQALKRLRSNLAGMPGFDPAS